MVCRVLYSKKCKESTDTPYTRTPGDTRHTISVQCLDTRCTCQCRHTELRDTGARPVVAPRLSPSRPQPGSRTQCTLHRCVQEPVCTRLRSCSHAPPPSPLPTCPHLRDCLSRLSCVRLTGLPASRGAQHEASRRGDAQASRRDAAQASRRGSWCHLRAGWAGEKQQGKHAGKHGSQQGKHAVHGAPKLACAGACCAGSVRAPFWMRST